MASRVSSWFGVVIGCLALVAFWALPLRSPEERHSDRSRSRTLAEVRAHRSVSAEVRRLGAVYQSLEWNDSLEILASVAWGTGSRISARVPESAEAGTEESLEEAIRIQLRSAGVSTPAMPVGSVFFSSTDGIHPSSPYPNGRIVGSLLFVRRDGVSPHCFLVGSGDSTVDLRREVGNLTWTGPDSTRAPNPLGPCVFHAKYGTPGDGTFAWLRSGGYRFAERYGPAARDPEKEPDQQLRFFGFRSPWGPFPGGRACVAGDRSSCRNIVLFLERYPPGWNYPWSEESQAYGLSPVAYTRRYTSFGVSETDTRLLFDLEEEFGSRRFATFWTSDEDVETAFREAFGEPMDGWVMGWAQERFSIPDASPRVPLSAGLLSFLSIGAFAGLAVIMGRRR